MRLLNAMKLLKKFKISNIKQSYCLKCRKNTDSINPRVSKTKKGKTILSKSATSGSKKSGFIKKQEASKILSNLGLKTPLSMVPLLGDKCLRIIKWMKQSIHFY